MEHHPRPLRLLIDPAQDGPTNMGVDDCLLADAEAGGPGALRLYRWRPATLSLGHFQRYADIAEQDASLAGLVVVRRVTGGGAILHADELTYSLSLPIDHRLAGGGPEVLYTWMHQRIADAVETLGGHTGFEGRGATSARGGPFMCFACHGRFDLMAHGAKLAGSAQRRTRRGLLQHGSVVLHRGHAAQPSAAMDELLGRAVGFDELAEAIVEAFGGAGVALAPATPSDPPAERLEEFRRRHADPAWIRRR